MVPPRDTRGPACPPAISATCAARRTLPDTPHTPKLLQFHEYTADFSATTARYSEIAELSKMGLTFAMGCTIIDQMLI
jgi:hypothetical protein